MLALVAAVFAILGLVPLMNNFAHIAGFVAGFLMCTVAVLNTRVPVLPAPLLLLGLLYACCLFLCCSWGSPTHCVWPCITVSWPATCALLASRCQACKQRIRRRETDAMLFSLAIFGLCELNSLVTQLSVCYKAHNTALGCKSVAANLFCCCRLTAACDAMWDVAWWCSLSPQHC